MPRDGSATRERLLDHAERLVIDQGFAATSVDQVIASAASSKGAFFNHFATKQALGSALVERYADVDVEHLRTALAEAEGASPDPARQLIELVRRFEDEGDELMASQPSCLYVSVLTEQQLIDDGTAEPILRAVHAWRSALADKIRAALATRPQLSIDPEGLADHVFVTFEGAFILCRSEGDPSHMRRQLAVLRTLLSALLLQ